MTKNGISEENLTKLFTHAQIGPKEQDMVRNLSFLGANITTDVSVIMFMSPNEHVNNLSFSISQGNRKKQYTVPRKERITEHTYQMSRWTPVVKDIVEDCIEEKLDARHFPFLAGRAQTGGGYHAPTR